MNVGEHLVLVGHADVVAVGGQPVGDLILAVLMLDERLDHLRTDAFLSNPLVGLDHQALLRRGMP